MPGIGDIQPVARGDDQLGGIRQQALGLDRLFNRLERGPVQQACFGKISQNGFDRLDVVIGIDLARIAADNFAARIDQNHRGPGPHGILLPDFVTGIVEDGVLDPQALGRLLDAGDLTLSREFGRMNADDDQLIGETLTEPGQLPDIMLAVYSAERPKLQQHNLPAQIG
jgi:hypothetical protein